MTAGQKMELLREFASKIKVGLDPTPFEHAVMWAYNEIVALQNLIDTKIKEAKWQTD